MIQRTPDACAARAAGRRTRIRRAAMATIPVVRTVMARLGGIRFIRQ
jgi:hypothetical protein